MTLTERGEMMAAGDEIYVGVKIVDALGSYQTEVEVSAASIKKNRPSEVVEPINTEYPIVVRNAKTNYYSGTITANFSNNTSGKCVDRQGYSAQYDFYDAEYKLGFIDWLVNGLTKNLYIADHYILPVQITNEVSGSGDYKVFDPSFKVTFGWVQVKPAIVI